MKKEIERKFIIKRIPKDVIFQKCENIKQGYLAVEPNGTEVRIRAKGPKFYLTIKKGFGLSRGELEIELNANQFNSLWSLTTGKRIIKNRYEFEYNNLKIEVDRYLGKHNSLIVAEVEFKSVRDSKQFIPPKWFDMEVTNDDKFKNKNLAG